MKKKEKLFGKVILWIMLIMIAVGFTIPTFFNDEEQQQNLPPRICQDDADCYLVCDEQPKAALCYQNLCQQNSCQEDSLYQTTSITATLKIVVEGETIDLKEQSEQLNNFFVQFEKDSFTSLAPLNLNQILDKLTMKLDSQCLKINNKDYCQENIDDLQLLVNGERSYAYGNHFLENNDEIEIIYSST
ncbi:MAG: hypothetical protein ABIA37_02030 [Candidatus Woesearchaeota archaeon]